MVQFDDIDPNLISFVSIRRKVSIPVLRDIIDAYNAGEPMIRISERYGIDRSKVREMLVQLGVHQSSPINPWDALELYEFIGMYGDVPALELSEYFLRAPEDLWSKASSLGITNYNEFDSVDMTDEQRYLVFAGLLGNATIYRSKSGRKYPAVEFVHSEREIEYLMYKQGVMQNLIQPTGVQRRVRQNSVYYRFVTRYLPCFEEVYTTVRDVNDEYYVTDDWLAELSHPMSLAVWYMDTGDIQPIYRNPEERRRGDTPRGYNLRLYLHVRSRDEAELIRDWLDREWGIDMNLRAWRHKTSGNWHFSLGRAVSYIVSDFVDLVEPYVVPSMRYKLDID